MMNPVEKIDRLWDSLRDTSRKRLLMTAAFMLIMVVIILGILFFGNLADLPQEGMDNLYILLSSSVIALVGVSVTGYIFLTESLRNIKESRPRFYSAADRYQRNVFKRLVRIFAIGIILVIVYAMMAYYLDTMDFLFNDVNVRTWMMLTGVISFIAFLALSVHYGTHVVARQLAVLVYLQLVGVYVVYAELALQVFPEVGEASTQDSYLVAAPLEH